MKAICLKQPFANFILFGWKPLESRTWSTTHRGPLLITVSQAIHQGTCLLDGNEYDCLDIIKMFWQLEMPLHQGKALCIADVKDCREMTLKDEAAACCHIYPNAKVWELENITPVRPFPIKGQLSVFNIGELTDEILPLDEPFKRDVIAPSREWLAELKNERFSNRQKL